MVTKEFLTVGDVATALGQTPARVYQRIHAHTLPAVQIGGRYRIPRLAFDQYLREQHEAKQLDKEVDLVTTEEIAHHLGVVVSRVRQLLRAGAIPATSTQPGSKHNRFLLTRDVWEAWVKESSQRASSGLKRR